MAHGVSFNIVLIHIFWRSVLEVTRYDAFLSSESLRSEATYILAAPSPFSRRNGNSTCCTEPRDFFVRDNQKETYVREGNSATQTGPRSLNDVLACNRFAGEGISTKLNVRDENIARLRLFRPIN